MVSDKLLQVWQVLLLSLNPCSNGIWSLTQVSYLNGEYNMSLNPCSNGIWSLTFDKNVYERIMTRS